METIYRSRGSLWWGLAALVGWLFLLGPRLGWLMDLVPPPYDDAAYFIYSYSILGSMLGIVLCVIQLFRDRPALRAGDRGVWFRLSLRRQGTVPWRLVSGISLAPDGTTVLLHLYGGSASEETPLARPAPGGGWVLPLPLRRKVRQPERACQMLQEWYRVDSCFSFQGKFFHFLAINRHREVEHNLSYPASVFPFLREHLNSLDKGFHKLSLFRFCCGMVDFIKCQ